MGFDSLVPSDSIGRYMDKEYETLQCFKRGESKLQRGFRRFQEIVFRMIRCCRGRALIDFGKNASEIAEEIEKCSELVNRLGRGAVYLGSATPGCNHPHYLNVIDLSREIADLLGCTTWAGAGSGLMEAALKGALQSGRPIGGFRVDKNAGRSSSAVTHPFLCSDTFQRFQLFSTMKTGFVDAVVRNNPSDRTAVVALPGGVGTLDEIFEILALFQQEQVIVSKHPIPFLFLNYDGYYSKLLDFLADCQRWSNLAKGEVSCTSTSQWKVCNDNAEALTYLSQFYNLPVRNVQT